jgi:signal transduction histidine kinase
VLVLDPPFTRSRPFALLCAAAAALLLAGAHRLRLRRERARLHAVLAERGRLARDVHDTLAQSFVAMSVQLECIDQALEQGDAATVRRHLDGARAVVKESVEEARRSVWVLRPQALERGLVTALETMVRRLSAGTRVELAVTGTPRPLAPAAEANLLRIAGEAVSNAYRHADARHIVVQLAFAGHSVRLAVTDDGAGIATAASGASQGLAGMRERAAELGGTLSIDRSPGGGTTISVEAPS